MSGRISATNSVSSSQSGSTASGQKRKFSDVFPQAAAPVRSRPSPLLSDTPIVDPPQDTVTNHPMEQDDDEDLTAGDFGAPVAPYVLKAAKLNEASINRDQAGSPSALSGSFSTRLHITNIVKPVATALQHVGDPLSCLSADVSRRVLQFLDAVSLVKLYATAKSKPLAAFNRKVLASRIPQGAHDVTSPLASSPIPRVLSFVANDDTDLTMSPMRPSGPGATNDLQSPVLAGTLQSFMQQAADGDEGRPPSARSSHLSAATTQPQLVVCAPESISSARQDKLSVSKQVGSSPAEENASIFMLIMPVAKLRAVTALQFKWPKPKTGKPQAAANLYSWPPSSEALARFAEVDGPTLPIPALSCIHPRAVVLDKYPDLPLSALQYKTKEPTSWLEVLNDIEHWQFLRKNVSSLHANMLSSNNAAGYPERWSKLDAGLEPDHILFDNMAKLKEKEDILARAYPFRSLYYMFNTGGEEWEIRMGWRKRLVEWLRNLSMHFTLPPPVLADAVALADRFAVQYAEKMGRTQLQLLYLTALSIAARVHRIPQDVIMTIRGLAPDYDQRDYLAMESHMVQIMGTTADRKADPFPTPAPANGRSTGSDASSAPEDKSTAETAETGPTRTTRLAPLGSPGTGVQPPARKKLLLPRTPGGICNRYSPLADNSTMPDVQMVVMTTPFAFAGHIICFLSRAWGEAIAHAVREALYLSMKYHDIQRYSPSTIAVAAVFLGLRAHKLWYTPTAAAWFDLVFRTLQVDVFCIRECAYLLSERGGLNSVLHKYETNARAELKRLFEKINASTQCAISTSSTVLTHISLLAVEDSKQSCIAKSVLDCWMFPSPEVSHPFTLSQDTGESVEDTLSEFDNLSVSSYITEREPWMGELGDDGEINIDAIDDPQCDSASAMQCRRAARRKVWVKQQHAKTRAPRTTTSGPTADNSHANGSLVGPSQDVTQGPATATPGSKPAYASHGSALSPMRDINMSGASPGEPERVPGRAGNGAIFATVGRSAPPQSLDDAKTPSKSMVIGSMPNTSNIIADDDVDMGGKGMGRPMVVGKTTNPRGLPAVRGAEFSPANHGPSFGSYEPLNSSMLGLGATPFGRASSAYNGAAGIPVPSFTDEDTHAVRKGPAARTGLLPSLLSPGKVHSSDASCNSSNGSRTDGIRLPAVRGAAQSNASSTRDDMSGMAVMNNAELSQAGSVTPSASRSHLAKMFQKAGTWLQRKGKDEPGK